MPTPARCWGPFHDEGNAAPLGDEEELVAEGLVEGQVLPSRVP